jgi:predicted AAA+ superfamily ATPase
MWRVGRTFSHGGMVTEWPYIIHSYLPSSIVEEVDARHTPMGHRPMRVYSYWDDQ